MSADQRYLDALSEVFSYASHVDEWITVKKELLKCLRPEHRTAFSTRDPITKKQRMNDLERELAQQWSVMTGRPVILTHDEKPTESKKAPS